MSFTLLSLISVLCSSAGAIVLGFMAFSLKARLQHLHQVQQEQRQLFAEHQVQLLKLIQESVGQHMQDVRNQISHTLLQQSTNLSTSVNQLTQATQQRLQDISRQVDHKLNEGFDKTHKTFMGVLQRLTIIDEAQKKITELSTNVVSLQEILVDKRSRGAFGEVQLSALIRNVLPEQHFAFQQLLSNGMRADCVLFLPEPSGHIAIDAKFPLESFRKFTDESLDSAERQRSMTQFKQDIRKHIKDIATKYILPGETADGAVMFIPAEAIFAEIHAHFPELVEYSQQSRVWMVSPTTMMAVLTTARAVLKDAATRQQVHIIQEHLAQLHQDFGRFQDRMDKLAKHIAQAHEDVEQVHKSSRKISNRFQKIEQVELGELGELGTPTPNLPEALDA